MRLNVLRSCGSLLPEQRPGNLLGCVQQSNLALFGFRSGFDTADDVTRCELGAFTPQDEAVKAGRIWQRLHREQTGRSSEVFYDVVTVYKTAADWLEDR
jgi:hypothetical protein